MHSLRDSFEAFSPFLSVILLVFDPFSPLFPPFPSSNMFQHVPTETSPTAPWWPLCHSGGVDHHGRGPGCSTRMANIRTYHELYYIYWIIIESWHSWHHYFFIVILCGSLWYLSIHRHPKRKSSLSATESEKVFGTWRECKTQRRECNWKWTALTQLWLWNLRQDTLRVLTFALVTIQSCFGSMTCRHTAVCTTKWDEIATDLQALVFITYTLSFLETLRVEWRRENSLVSTSISALVLDFPSDQTALLRLRKPCNL